MHFKLLILNSNSYINLNNMFQGFSFIKKRKPSCEESVANEQTNQNVDSKDSNTSMETASEMDVETIQSTYREGGKSIQNVGTQNVQTMLQTNQASLDGRRGKGPKSENSQSWAEQRSYAPKGETRGFRMENASSVHQQESLLEPQIMNQTMKVPRLKNLPAAARSNDHSTRSGVAYHLQMSVNDGEVPNIKMPSCGDRMGRRPKVLVDERQIDQASYLDSRKASAVAATEQSAAAQASICQNEVKNLVTRLYKFEQQRQQKLKHAQDKKTKKEM